MTFATADVLETPSPVREVLTTRSEFMGCVHVPINRNHITAFRLTPEVRQTNPVRAAIEDSTFFTHAEATLLGRVGKPSSRNHDNH